MAVYVRSIPDVLVTRHPGRVRVVAPTACALPDFVALVALLAALAAAVAAGLWVLAVELAAGLVPSAVALLEEPRFDGSTAAVGASATILAILGLWIILWLPLEMLLGKETIDITPDALTITRGAGVVEWELVIPTARIAAWRDVEPPATWRHRLLGYRSMRSGKNGRLELTLADGQRVRLGTVPPGTSLRLLRGAVTRALEDVRTADPGPGAQSHAAAAP